jgi:CRP/FNR family cyclic AMP-dependent transcriptional regulator
MLEVTAAALATQRFLHGMQPGQLTALAEAASEVAFPAGHRIFDEGDNAEHFWLIESGYVVLDVQVPGEGMAIVGRVGIGELLGWSWLLPPYQWTLGAVCATEVKAFEFNAQVIRDGCAADPALRDELMQRLLHVLSGRLMNTKSTLITRSTP